MDADRFDTLTRLMRSRTSRRLTVALAATGLLSIAVPEAEALRCSAARPCPECYRCKRHRCRKKAPGAACADDGNPCTDDECDGNGNCTHPNKPVGFVCRDAFCANGVETREATCDGDGTCQNSTTKSCTPYKCHETLPICGGSCGGPGDCISTHFCDGGVCKPKKDNGESCAFGTECDSGFCSPADHFCCDTGCDATGQTCSGGTCTCPPNESVCGFACAPIGLACDGNDGDLCQEGVFVCDNGNVVCSDTTGTTLEIPGNGVDEDCRPQPTD